MRDHFARQTTMTSAAARLERGEAGEAAAVSRASTDQPAAPAIDGEMLPGIDAVGEVLFSPEMLGDALAASIKRASAIETDKAKEITVRRRSGARRERCARGSADHP